MSVLTVQLSDSMTMRLLHESHRRNLPEDAIVEQALEQTLPVEKSAAKPTVFARLQALIVDDPDSPVDLATNPTHLEGFGVSRPA